MLEFVFVPPPLHCWLRPDLELDRLGKTILPIHNPWKLRTHRVGPLLYSGSSICSAMIALEQQYHQLTAEKDAHRWKRATILEGGVCCRLSIKQPSKWPSERTIERKLSKTCSGGVAMIWNNTPWPDQSDDKEKVAGCVSRGILLSRKVSRS